MYCIIVYAVLNSYVINLLSFLIYENDGCR